MLCHTAEHCDALEALETQPPAMRAAWVGESHVPQNGMPLARSGWSVGGQDMYHNEHTARAARLAAGGVLALTQRVCTGQLSAGFAVVRPPGHHACSDKMCGFCFLNSAAIAARFAVRRHRMARVLLLDWDVHHGNGTQQIFDDDPSVLYVSLHRLAQGFFPGTGVSRTHSDPRADGGQRMPTRAYWPAMRRECARAHVRTSRPLPPRRRRRTRWAWARAKVSA